MTSTAVRDPVFGCLLDQGKQDRDGYVYAGKSRAHIVAYERIHGQVGAGIELDHLCRRRHCREDRHLEPVTRRENERRKDWAYRAQRATCPRGHDLRVHRQVTPERGIVCRACNTEAGAIT